MKKYTKLVLKESSHIDIADSVIDKLEDGWLKTIPVGDQTIVIFSKQQEFNPDTRV